MSSCHVYLSEQFLQMYTGRSFLHWRHIIHPVIVDAAVVKELTPESKWPAIVLSVFWGDPLLL